MGLFFRLSFSLSLFHFLPQRMSDMGRGKAFKISIYELKNSVREENILIPSTHTHTHTTTKQNQSQAKEMSSLTYNHRALLSSGPAQRKRNKGNSSYYRLLGTK